MIKSFRCKETERLWGGLFSRKLPTDLQKRALKKLQLLHAAGAIEHLILPPSNRLEPLQGDRKGQWSLCINDQWRLCFSWQDGHAHGVEIIDYH